MNNEIAILVLNSHIKHSRYPIPGTVIRGIKLKDGLWDHTVGTYRPYDVILPWFYRESEYNSWREVYNWLPTTWKEHCDALRAKEAKFQGKGKLVGRDPQSFERYVAEEQKLRNRFRRKISLGKLHPKPSMKVLLKKYKNP